MLATWWRQATPGSAYWRCEVPGRHLPGDVLRLQPDDLQPHPETGDPFMPRQQTGCAILQFPGNATQGLLLAHHQQEGRRALVEVDDTYLLPAPMVRGIKPWDARIDRTHPERDSHEAHRRIVGFADGVIVSTPTLAAAYRNLNRSIYVCPNSVDPDDWPEPFKTDDGVLRVGYAGSDTHLYDVALAERALSWAAHQDGVEVVVMGFRSRRFSFPHRLIDWTDTLADYRAALPLIDVGLCPLKSSVWHDCKSDVKALEYAAAGAFPVVSRVPPYQPWWGRETPSLSCSTAKEFLKAVRWCVKHRDEIRQLGRDARAHVLAERGIERSIHLWHEAVTG